MRNHTALKAFLIVLGLTALFAGYLYIQPMRPANAAECFRDYSKYLKFSPDDPEKILVYTEYAGDHKEDGYYVTVQNTSEKYWCGVLELKDEAGNSVYAEEYVNFGPGEVKAFHLTPSSGISGYKTSRNKFYRFTYKMPEVMPDESNDQNGAGDYAWMNLLYKEGECTPERLKEYANYIFAKKILEGNEVLDGYCYDRARVQYTEEDGIRYPLRDSAVYVIVFDAENRSAKIVDSSANMEVLEEFSLK